MTQVASTARGAVRERVGVATAMLLVSALAWLYLAYRADPNAGTSMDVMDAMSMHDWSVTDFVLTWLMWAVMMAAMMLPSVIPLTYVYVAISRKARRQGNVVPAASLFVSGYLVVWAAFSILATSLQLFLDRAAMLTDSWRTTSVGLAGALLLAAGIYELTPLKRACLRVCRGPIDFVTRHWRKGTAGVVRLGTLAGVYCLGCCAVLMGLLFVGGVMNLLWVAVISAFVLLEKLLPGGELTSRLAGVAMALGGLGLLVAAAG
jgi:predicted metal-binding membrane protein